MNAIAFIVVFQSMNSILTKGVLRGGGDTKFLMVADILKSVWCIFRLRSGKWIKNISSGEVKDAKQAESGSDAVSAVF